MRFFSITPKQEEIMMLIYKFRFLDRIHIQTILNHKDAKRINVWLKDLVEKKYLGRIYSTKLLDNTKPAIYYAAINGIHFFRRKEECHPELLSRLRKEPYRSIRFRNHCLYLAHIYVYLFTSKNTEFTFESFETKVDLHNYENMLTPYPDAFIMLNKQTGNRKQKKQYFLELIDEGTPRYALRYRIKQCLDYFENHTDTIKSLIICPNQLTLKFLEKFITKTLEDEYCFGNKASFSLALANEVKEKGLLNDIWITISKLTTS